MHVYSIALRFFGIAPNGRAAGLMVGALLPPLPRMFCANRLILAGVAHGAITLFLERPPVFTFCFEGVYFHK